jgi:hypothetical protein
VRAVLYRTAGDGMETWKGTSISGKAKQKLRIRAKPNPGEEERTNQITLL